MKRKMTLSLMLTLSMLLSLVSFTLTAQGQPPPQRFRADSGVVTLAANQILRITVAGDAGNDAIRVRIRWMQYSTQGCSGMPPVCRHMVVSQGAMPAETLGSDDALSFDVPGTGNGVRLLVLSNRQVQVLAQIIDSQGHVVVAFTVNPASLPTGL